jgi:DNA polymerase III delta prime subunit
MKIFDPTKSVWYERYKPACIDDLVIPQEIKIKIHKYVQTQNLPHFGLFSSNPGTGKSSTAHAIIKELGGEALWINASMDKGIDVLRGRISKFASQGSFDGNIKIVVMDEFDNFSTDGQKAFRGFIDEFSQNCRFIFTGNYKEKIIEPLLERLEVYDFNSFPKEEMIKPIFERLKFVLTNENIQFDPKDLVPIINTYYPRIRSMVGNLQKFSNDGVFKVSEGELDDLNSFDEVMKLVNPANYLDMINAVNKLNAPTNMYSFLYKNAGKYFKPDSYPNVVITIAKYQHMAETSRDGNLCLAAALTELMKLIK